MVTEHAYICHQLIGLRVTQDFTVAKLAILTYLRLLKMIKLKATGNLSYGQKC